MCLFLNTGNLLKTNTRLKSSSLSCQGDNSESVSPPTSASISSCIYMEPNILNSDYSQFKNPNRIDMLGSVAERESKPFH